MPFIAREMTEFTPPLRIKFDELEVVFDLFSGLLEDPSQYRGKRNDGGAHVESEPFFRQHRCFPA